MHWAKSEGRRLEDSDLGRIHPDFIKKAYWWKSNTPKRIFTKKKNQQMSLFQKFITEGNEQSDEPSKGSELDGGAVAQVSAMQYAASYH